MRYHSIKQIACLCLLSAALACPSISRAADYTVHSGWDLFPTVSALFQGVPFQGVPLGTYDFGGSIGVQPVGNTDTIIQRAGPISGSSGGTVGFLGAMVAWQLRSVNPYDPDGAGPAPVGYYYLTLQSARGGPLSTDSGSMFFNPDNTRGTFSDTLHVFWDLRYDGLTGDNIVFSGEHLMQNTRADWTHNGSYPPIIDDVNNELYASGNTSEDFWTPYVVHFNPVGDIHIVPEPSCLALLCLGVLCLSIKTRRGRK